MGKNFAVNSKIIPHPMGQLNLAVGTIAAILDYPKIFAGKKSHQCPTFLRQG
jgi:hypothetical protein